MDKDGGFPGGDGGFGPGVETMPGATGFYYITPGDEWDDTPSRRGSFRMLMTLNGYILRELVKGVLMSTAVFSVIIIGVFSGQVIRDGVGPVTLLKVMPNFMPLICPFVLPLAIITGILICYSRLARDNEITASYAGGIGPFWIIFPSFLVAVFAIFITLTLNEVAMLPAMRGIEKMIAEDQANILMRMMTRPGNITVQASDEYIAMSKLEPERDPEHRSALDATRFVNPYPAAPAEGWNPAYPYPTKRVVARDHSIHDFSDGKSGELALKLAIIKPIFQDLHSTDINKIFIAYSDYGEEQVVLNRHGRVSFNSNRASYWPILMLVDTRRAAEERLAGLKATLLKAVGLQPAQVTAVGKMVAEEEKLIRSRTADINMRLALCFSCFAFAVMGIPLGMRTKGSAANSFATGIAMSAVYFLALRFADMQVSDGFLPYWIIWLPDALVAAIGLVMWRRMRLA